MSHCLPTVRRLRWVACVSFFILFAGCSDNLIPDTENPSNSILGLNALAQQRYDWARIYFEREQQINPKHPEAWRLAGDAWIQGYQQSYSRAVEAYKQYLNLSPDDAPVRRQLIQLYLTLDQNEQAQAELLKLGDSAEDEAIRAKTLKNNQPEAAQMAAQRALSNHNDDAELWQLLAELAFSADDESNALKFSAIALDADPLLAKAHFLRSRLFRAKRDMQNLREALDDHAAATTLTAANPRAEHVTEALRRLEERFGANHPQLLKQRVELGFALKDTSMMAIALSRLDTQQGLSPSELLRFAVNAEEMGLRSDATRLFQSVLRLRPDNSAAIASLGMLALANGDLNQAEQRLKQGLERAPESARLHYLSARLAVAKEQPERALTEMLRALRLAPWEWPWRIQTAELLHADGQNDEITRLFNDAPEANTQLDAAEKRFNETVIKD